MRFQYVGHCSKHGSGTVASIIAYGDVTKACSQTLWRRFQVFRTRTATTNEGWRLMKAAAVGFSHKWSLFTAALVGRLWECAQRSSEMEQFHLEHKERDFVRLYSFYTKTFLLETQF